MQDPHKSVDRFTNDREALDFLASRIADEAQRDGVPFSEIERKMLYFSETAWTLPEIWEVNDEFDQKYDQNAYEKKISQLIKKAATRARKQQHEEFESWKEAIRRLSKEDRYLLIMVERAGLGRKYRPTRPPGDLWKLWGTGIAIVGLVLGISWIAAEYHLDSGTGSASSRDFLQFAIWTIVVCAAVIYGLLQILFGAQRVNRITSRVLAWFFGPSERSK